MKETGIVRKIDELGRLVIPMELRRSFDIQENAPMEIFTDNGCIIIKPYKPHCACCGDDREGHSIHKGLRICPACLKELKRL